GEQRMGGAGILVAGNPADGSKSGFTDVEISGCECHDNAYYGILITGAWDTKATTYANADVRILDCRVHDNPGDPLYHENHSGSGLLVEDCDGGLVDRCVAWENGAQCDGAPGGPCGIWTAVANNVVIQRCEAFRNRTGTSADGNGFDLDGGCTNCVLQYNYAHDNDGAGILVYTYQDSPHRHHGNVVRWNVCENNAVKKRQYGELYVGDGGDGLSGVEVYHNTFITDQPAEAVVSVVGRKIGVALRNNLIVSTGRVRAVLVEQDAPEIVIQGNAYWNDGFFARLGSRDIADLAAWQAAGKELAGTTPLGVWAEPQLDLASARGTEGEVARLPRLTAFVPKATSPATRTGIDLKAKAGIQRGPRDFRDRPLAGVRKPFAGACAIE
ncbi:MAG: right-handed parallel beta-helix repeat-containing protein, partial [Planctomycetes bacterium]|nr:right-handed parallel beta-helix repeat-containing protein [Planctomycetota bacterium]